MYKVSSSGPSAARGGRRHREARAPAYPRVSATDAATGVL